MAKRPLSDAELRLWKKITETVSPLQSSPKTECPDVEDFGKLLSTYSHLDASRLKNQKRQFTPKEPVKARATQLQRNLVDIVEEVVPKTPLENKENDKKVRRGKTDVDATIDLHGFTQVAARSALSAFLMHHRNSGAKCVLVITGKGKLGDGVIKRSLLDWLVEPDIRAHVSSYSQSHQKHGGAGAYYIFLRKQRWER